MTKEYFGSYCKYDDLLCSVDASSFSMLEKFNKIFSELDDYPSYFCIDTDNGQEYPISVSVNGFTTTNPIWIRRFCDAVIYKEDPFDFEPK